MGCDIHMIVEKSTQGGWIEVHNTRKSVCRWCDGLGHYSGRPKDLCYSCKGEKVVLEGFDPGRNYRLFSILADVRNSWDIEPIAEPRGLPEDTTCDFWLGDHSHSWLSLRELIEHDWDQVFKLNGWLNAKEYAVFRERGIPVSWCRRVSGGKVKHITNTEMDKILEEGPPDDCSYYTEVSWVASQRYYTEYFLNEVVGRLVALGHPDEIRIVFGFDS